MVAITRVWIMMDKMTENVRNGQNVRSGALTMQVKASHQPLQASYLDAIKHNFIFIFLNAKLIAKKICFVVWSDIIY